MVQLLGELVGLESPSTDKAAVDRFGTFLRDQLEGLGAEVEVLAQEEAGNHLLARWGEGEGGTLMLGHMDTVWPLGTTAERPYRVEGGWAYGPGVLDMKACIVIGLYAIQALQALGRMPSAPLACLFNSDEEIKSFSSRRAIIAEAARSRVVYVLEPATSPEGALKTARKGVGGFQMWVKGRAAHAGSAPEEGRSAILELAHQVVRLHSLNDPATGTTVNVGLTRGGTRSNVVAAEAYAEIDLRVMTPEEGQRMEELIAGLQPETPDVELRVEGGMNRPPMVRTAQIAELFQGARRLAAELGVDLQEGLSGGGSDGNLTAAAGTPTLDGLGGVGEGSHAVHERVLISSLPERAALLAGLLTGT
jgi:glutamate carboxypeptidase